jgi:Spy/CpxP family protein refolding chaperone
MEAMLKTLTRKTMQVALATLALAGLASVPVLAQEAPTQQPAASPGAINWQSLDLTPAQIKQINLLRLQYNQTAIKLKAEANLKQLEIQKQLMAPAANPNTVRQLLQEKLSLDSKLQAASLDNFLAIRKLLTPQQLAKLPQAITLK